MLKLQFPMLHPDTNMKRAAYYQPTQLPAKRRKTAAHLLMETDDSSWEDSILLFDLESFETSNLSSPADQEQSFLSWALEDNDACFADNKLQTPLDLDQVSRAARPMHIESCDAIPAAVSPVLNPSPSMAELVPPIQNPTPEVSTALFPISNIKNSKEPTLLALTSYPYRVLYCNEAFTKLSPRKTSVIGDSVFDAFDIEGSILRPSLATYPTLLGRLDNQIALVPSSTDDDQSNQRCAVQAYGVSEQNSPNELQYLAVRLSPIQEPSL